MIVHKHYPKWAGLGWLAGSADTPAQARTRADEWDADPDLGSYGPHRIIEVVTTQTEITR